MDRWFRRGERVALREVWKGRVFQARAATVVEDTPVRSIFYVPPVVRCLEPTSDDGEHLRMPTRDWRLEGTEWHHARVLSFAFPDTPYAVLASWDPDTDEFRGWYVNLQEPLRRTDVGFDTEEHVLDVLVSPDRSTWSWKDEDELAQAIDEGLFTEEEAERFRAAGERAVEQIILREPPFDEDWEHWKPEPEWETPELPEAVEAAPAAVSHTGCRARPHPRGYGAMPDLSALRDRFPALARTGADGRPLVIVDAPGGSQVPDTVIEAVSARYRDGVSNLDGAFPTSRETGDVVAAARRAGADLVGTDPERIVFGQNSTSLLFHLARSFTRTLAPGDEVVVTRLDHDANVRPWVMAARDAGATLRWVDLRPEDATLDEASFDEALGDRTRLVAFTLASNGVGTITPAARLVRRAKDAGALVAVDGVHLAQHRSIGFDELGADVLAVSPYKVFGPHLGMVAARPEVLDGWDPYRVRPAEDYPSPERWETGTQNHEGLAGFVAAVDYLAEAGRTFGAPSAGTRRAEIRAAFDAFAAHERNLARRFLEGFARIPGARLWGIGSPDRLEERTPTFAIRLGDRHPLETAEILGELGIFVWDGHYYAMELFERLGLLDSGGAVRIGFCHYHTADEVDRVLGALEGLS